MAENILIVNAVTGEIIERERNAAEQVIHAKDTAASEAAEAVTQAAEADRVSTIQAARDHALGLGFTDAMLAVMYPQLEGA